MVIVAKLHQFSHISEMRGTWCRRRWRTKKAAKRLLGSGVQAPHCNCICMSWLQANLAMSLFFIVSSVKWVWYFRIWNHFFFRCFSFLHINIFHFACFIFNLTSSKSSLIFHEYQHQGYWRYVDYVSRFPCFWSRNRYVQCFFLHLFQNFYMHTQSMREYLCEHFYNWFKSTLKYSKINREKHFFFFSKNKTIKRRNKITVVEKTMCLKWVQKKRNNNNNDDEKYIST